MRGHEWVRMGSAIACAAVLAGGSAEAQQTSFGGQVRPRLESRDPGPGGTADTFTSMRVRLGLTATMSNSLSVFIQAQDVRVWGEETDPLFDFRGDAIDVHQAYFRYQGSQLDWLTATVGRQETTFGGERLVGPVGWTQQGQAFDGARLDLAGEPGSISLIAYTLADISAAPATENRQLYGAYATRADAGPGALEAYWLYERATGTTDTDEHSFGARYVYSGEFDGRAEFTYQTGTRADADVKAWMIGLRAGTSVADDRATLSLWFDHLSGDDPATADIETFSPRYGTNHKFYGLADIFTNLPLHTGGAGLQDIAGKLSVAVMDDVNAGVDVHVFRVAEQGALSGTHFGDEIDITLTHQYSANLGVTAGFSYIVQDDPLAEVGRLGEDLTWFYVMFDAVF
jgi:hypothetical protein